MMMNSLWFCLSGKFFISPSFLRDNFAVLGILGWQCFPLCSWTISFHSLLAFNISAEKFTGNLIEALFYVMSHFSFAASKIFSLFLTFAYLFNVSWWRLLWVSQSFLFLNLNVHLLPWNWEIFEHYFFKYALCTFLSFFSFGTSIYL